MLVKGDTDRSFSGKFIFRGVCFNLLGLISVLFADFKI